MSIFWNHEEALSASGVVEMDDSLSKNTVQATLKKLLRTGMLKVDRIGYSGTVLTRFYLPVMTQAEWVSRTLSQQSLAGLVSHFIEGTDNLEVLDNLNALIENKRKEIERGE